MTTLLPGTTSSGMYCGKGPWYRRSCTDGPGPKSCFSQLWDGTNARAAFDPRLAARVAAPAVWRKSRRFMAVLLAASKYLRYREPCPCLARGAAAPRMMSTTQGVLLMFSVVFSLCLALV